MFSKQFFDLHKHNKPLLLGNIWDAHSAQVFQGAGYKAIGTSSAAIASSLGFDDGEQILFEDLLSVVKKIQTKIKIPLTVDIEGGYSRDTNEICKNIEILAKLNIAGINIEDSIVNKHRKILPAKEFSEVIKKIRSYIKENNINIFLNIRTDSYILGLDYPFDETITRINQYEKAGADGVFIPCITNCEEIKKIVQSTTLPVNVMMPDLPDFNILTNIGIKRISMGPFVYNDLMKKCKDTISDIIEKQSFRN